MQSSEYLKNLNDKIIVNPSEIKQFIQDIPRVSDNMIFSNFKTLEDEHMLCNVIGTLLARISISARRSKQAFTSMWDNLKKFLQLVLNDALKIENRRENINNIMRQILQLGIKPEGTMIFCDCNWLAMDWDIQIGNIIYSNDIKHVNVIENDLNLKTLSLFCEKFHVPDFSNIFLRISNSDSVIIDLFFKRYYNHQTVSDYILTRDMIPHEIIVNLKNLPSTELIKLPFDTIKLLISKIDHLITNGNTREQQAVFELLAAISESLHYISDNCPNSYTLADIVNNYDISLTTSDSVLSKYWSFVSSMMSFEHCELHLLESKIFYTLKSESMLKSKI
jgi:hypothetical protein